MIDVSNIFYPTLTLPFIRGGNRISPLYKGGNNVIKITANHFSNNLLVRRGIEGGFYI
jgi:hypothetical protein